MSKYYFLSEKIKPQTAFAYTEGETPVSHELISKVEKKDALPFRLVLKKLIRRKDGVTASDNLTGLKHIWLDYQPNNLAWPLMSEKMKEVIEEHLTGNEGIKWASVNIISDEDKRIYYIPRFTNTLDVLDREKTNYVEGTNHIIKPVFALSKISNFALFYQPQEFWQITSAIYVNDELKQRIQQADLTGVGFENITISF